MDILWGGTIFTCGHIYNPSENGDKRPVILRIEDIACPRCDRKEFHMRVIADLSIHGLSDAVDSLPSFIDEAERRFAARCL